MTDEEKLAERYVNGIPIFAEEGEGFSRTQMQRAFLAGLKAGKDEWHKLDWEKDYPEAEEWLCNNLHSASEEDFIKAMVDIAEPREKRIAELEQEKCELLGIIQGKDKAIKELEERIEKMKCCQNCKHHYWLYEELSCRIHKIDVDTCNSWEMKND